MQYVLIPDEWGKSSDTQGPANVTRVIHVLIPDEWGKSSDLTMLSATTEIAVLIPDEWGKSSDQRFKVWKHQARES